jgi:hypothetical protein
MEIASSTHSLLPLNSSPAATRMSIAQFQLHSLCVDALGLCHHWGQLTPALHDPVAVAFAIKPRLSPTTPLRIEMTISDTRALWPARPCIKSNSEDFFHFYLTRVFGQNLAGLCSR